MKRNIGEESNVMSIRDGIVVTVLATVAVLTSGNVAPEMPEKDILPTKCIYYTPSIEMSEVVPVVNSLKRENKNKIRDMAKLESNWNGNGAEEFSEEAILLFGDIIDNILRQPEIAPTGRNSLLMQYSLDDGSFLAFEVSETCVNQVYIPQGDYTKAEETLFDHSFIENINSSVEAFYGRGLC